MTETRKNSKKSGYTFIGDAAAEKIVADALSEISAAVAASEFAGRVKYLVLGGGYGRGEGGVLRLPDGGVKLYNDLDFFVFSRTASRVENGKIDEFFSKISSQIGGKLGIDVDFSKSKNSAYAASRGNMMMFREMARGGKIVYGSAEEFSREMNFSGELPPIEYAKLMFNRVSGMVFARAKLFESGERILPSDADFVCRNINKAVLACGDAFLASRGICEFETSEKLRAILSAEMPEKLARLPELFAKAVEYKMSPNFDREKRDITETFKNALSLCDAVVSTLCEYLASRRGECFSDFLKREVRLFSVRKNFIRGGWRKPKLTENPYVFSLMFAMSLSSADDSNFSLSAEREYVKIWESLS